MELYRKANVKCVIGQIRIVKESYIFEHVILRKMVVFCQIFS
jgi:hypothetical protein